MTAASPSEPIAWLFEHKTLPIDERSVFAYAMTPEGVRIKGFAIGGVNLAEEPVGAVEGIVKPDAQPHDLKLTLSVEMPGEHEGGAQPVGGSGRRSARWHDPVAGSVQARVSLPVGDEGRNDAA